MEIKDYLTEYYENYDEDSRLTSFRRGKLEYLTTMGYIQAYLKPGDQILEIGAGTGRYSAALAEMGYDVTAVELVLHNLEILKRKITSEMKLTALEGDALNLNMLESDRYDMTLLLGPLYHLYTKEDKERAISEALRVTKPGGIVMAAYCISEGTIIEYVFRQNHLPEILQNDMMDLRTFDLKSEPKELFDMVRKSDIDEMMAGFPVQRLHYVATDGLSYFMRRELEEMDEQAFSVFLTYHLTVCENPDLVGATAHSLDIFRKG